MLNQLSASWDELGAELKVDSNERDKLKKDSTLTDDGRLEKLLVIWIRSQPSCVTWETIQNGLVKIKRIDVAKTLRMYLHDNVYDKYIKLNDFTPF